jgi:hypothetical protein
MTPTAAVDRYLACWGERDRAALRDRLGPVCQDGIEYIDPFVQLVDLAALVEHMARLASIVAGRRVARTTELQQSGPWCRFGWSLQPLMAGADLFGESTVHFDGTERMARMVTFHGHLPDRSFVYR